jgi:hypothetical protein
MSLYEVSEIVPGESFLARDLVSGGEPVRVSEHAATRQLKPWDRLGARIVKLPTKNVIGGGVLAFDRFVSERLLQTLQQARRKVRKQAVKTARKEGFGDGSEIVGDVLADAILLQSAGPLFTETWLADALDRVLNPRLPELRNTDGDEIVWTIVHFPLAYGASGGAIRAALAALPALRPEGDSFWNWIEFTTASVFKQPEAAESSAQTFATYMDDGALVLGNVELKERELTLSANSRARAERGQAMLAPILAGLVDTPLTELQTTEQVIAALPNTSKEERCGLSPEEQDAVLRETLDRHYAAVLDEKVPALDDVTPRQAVKTAKGRAKLVAWLKDLENRTAARDADSPLAKYDFGWMWEKLGIAELRK